MKKFFLIGAFVIALSGGARSQHILIAQRNGDGYELAISEKSFAVLFNSMVVPYLNGGSGQQYTYRDMAIDDPGPADRGAVAYLVVRANSERETVTMGVNLIKEVYSDRATSLYIVNSSTPAGGGPDRASSDGGWKCTSNRAECGGCRKIRDQGQVVGCACINGEGSYCNFETAGGGGSNWPGWLTSLLLALLRSV